MASDSGQSQVPTTQNLSLCYATAIFSCFGPAFGDRAENGIHNASRIDQLHLNSRDDWGYFAKMCAQVNGIFFRGDEAVGLLLISQFEQMANVIGRVLVMIAVKPFRDWLNAIGPQLLDKLVRAGDAAEDDRILWAL